MIETWFTSDHHLGHKNILEYEKEARPFSNLTEMHEVLIDRHNSVVKKNDIVYFLGDFSFGRKNIELAERFNGKKRLVLGNHDTYPSAEYLKYFDKLYGVLFWERCILSHMPVHPNGLGARWWLNIHGHLHSKNVTTSLYVTGENIYGKLEIVTDMNYFNVSVEQNNLTPFHRDVIMQRLKEIS